MKYLWLTLLIGCMAISAAVAQRSISGTVIDEAGDPLIGANILVKNSNPVIGTVTDLEGNYMLEVPEGYEVLTVSFTGFTTQEITLGVDNLLNVTLKAGVNLDDVVVTALGISRDEKSLGYAVTEVSGDEVSGSGEQNAIQGLSAKVAGVQVIGSGGVPGASSKILIRGNSTFTGENQPLMVVDGVPYDNQTLGSVAGDYPFNAGLNGINNSNRALDLNPEDIESVTVLKGPAAAALYGTRAANGALIITTKRGRSSKKKGFDVDFETNLDISQVNRMPKLQNEFAQGNGGGDWNANGDGINEDGEFATFGYLGGGGTANSWGPRIDGPGDTIAGWDLKAYDNIGRYFRTGFSTNNNLSISGGNQYTNFRLSYGNTYQQGIVPNTDLMRNTLRLNAQLGNEKFKVIGNAAYTNTRGNRAQNGSNLSGVMLSLTRMPASFDMLGGTDSLGYQNLDGSQHQYIAIYDNPLWSAYNNTNDNNVNRFTGALTATYKPFEGTEVPVGLEITYRLGTDTYNDYRKQVFAVGSWDPVNNLGEIWENSKRRLEVNSDLLITVSKDFGDKISTSLMVGSNLNHRFDGDLFARGRDLAIPGFYNLSNATNLYASEARFFKRLAGMFFDLNFGYGGMLYIDIAGRNDWASTFGEARRKKGFFYPSASLSFVFSELIPANKVLSFGKLRVGFAQAGREPGLYSSTTYFGKAPLTDGFTDGVGFPFLGTNGFGYAGLLGNKDLLPEISTGIEAGLDLRFWNGRIKLDLNYYRQLSSNLLVARPIAVSSGFENVYSNSGKMVNTGFEAMLSADVIKMDKFTWNLSANFALNRNKVLALEEGVDRIDIESAFESIGSFAIVGSPYGVLYASVWERDDNGNLIIGPDGLPIQSGEYESVGNPFPKWLMGIRNTFSFFGVTVGALLDIRQGGDIWGGTYARLQRLGQTLESADRDQPYLIEGVKQQVDDQGNGVFDADGNPVASSTNNDVEVSPFEYFVYYKGDFGATEEAVFDGSWVRLRELSVSYALPTKLLQGSKFIRSLSIYFTGRNLALHTKYPGVDPETSLTGAGSNVNGFDYFNMPNSMSFIVGLRAGF